MRVREYGETLMLCCEVNGSWGWYAHPSLMPGVSFLERRSQKIHVRYFEFIFCPRCDPEFNEIASFVNRTAVFICFRIVQRHRLMADWADRSLKGEQLIVVHLGPSGNARRRSICQNYLMAAIGLFVRYRTDTPLFLFKGRAAIFRRPSWTWPPPVLYAL
jgi:hypothetical protein